MLPWNRRTHRAQYVPSSPGLPPPYLLPLLSSGVFSAKLTLCAERLARAPMLRVLGFCSGARGTFAPSPPIRFHVFPKTAPETLHPDSGSLRARGWHEIVHPLQVCGYRCTNCP